MAKQGVKKGKDREKTARQRLADAQAAWQQAQQKLTLARERGEQEIEQVRQRAEKRVKKASRRVERHAQAVARAEEDLRGLTVPRSQSILVTTTAKEPRRPAEPVATLVPVEEPVGTTGAIVDDNSEPELRERELRALQALRGIASSDGVTAQQWRAASGMPNTTFLRARRELVDRGLVYQNGTDDGNVRYYLADQSPGH